MCTAELAARDCGAGTKRNVVLRAMHGVWLIHGNVRPGNILIRPDGSPMLLGFEAARWTLAEPLVKAERLVTLTKKRLQADFAQALTQV